MKCLFFTLIFSLTYSVFAQTPNIQLKLLSAGPNERFGLSIGASIELKISAKKSIQGIFLGKMVQNIDLHDELMILKKDKKDVIFVDADQVSIPNNLTVQNIATPLDQGQETCSAYAVYNFWNQLNQSQFKESKSLTEMFSNERNRRLFLEEAIIRYYVENQVDLETIMKAYGKRYNYSCREKTFNSLALMQNFLIQKGKIGSPTMIEFWLESGGDMYDAEYGYHDYETNEYYDARLWIPRKKGNRKSSSGHMIVIAASFLYNGKQQFLVLDANWQQPRIWDMEKVLGKETAFKELIFHTCQ